MKLRIPLVLVGCLIGASAYAAEAPDIFGNQGPVYSDATLRGFQVMNVSLGMTLSDAAAALGQNGFKPVEKIVERRTNGSNKIGEDVTFHGVEGEIALTYAKLTDQPARVTGVFYSKMEANSKDSQSFSERASRTFERYGWPSVFEMETSDKAHPAASFSWFSQESFRDDHVLKDVRVCHADWHRSSAEKGLNCEEILRNSNSVELSVILEGDTTLYQLNDYRSAYESLRTNVEFMKQRRKVGVASRM